MSEQAHARTTSRIKRFCQLPTWLRVTKLREPLSRTHEGTTKTIPAADGQISPIIMDEAKPFRLLDLPDEIWSKIGKMVIDDMPMVTQERFRVRKTTSYGYKHFDLPPPGNMRIHPITRTCKKLRYEFLPYYYATKVDIRMHLVPEEASLLGTWLRMIGPEGRRCVSKIWIMTRWWNAQDLRRYLSSKWRAEDFELVDEGVVDLGARHKVSKFRVQFP